MDILVPLLQYGDLIIRKEAALAVPLVEYGDSRLFVKSSTTARIDWTVSKGLTITVSIILVEYGHKSNHAAIQFIGILTSWKR